MPATKTPQALFGFYSQGSDDATDPELNRRCLHDLVLYSIPPRLDQEKLRAGLQEAFVTQPFILDLVEFIKEQKSVRFGAVNNWIHSKCSDVPLPYRWESKENTNILYNWLDYFFDEIRWEVPGARSQVIYWEG